MYVISDYFVKVRHRRYNIFSSINLYLPVFDDSKHALAEETSKLLVVRPVLTPQNTDNNQTPSLPLPLPSPRTCTSLPLPTHLQTQQCDQRRLLLPPLSLSTCLCGTIPSYPHPLPLTPLPHPPARYYPRDADAVGLRVLPRCCTTSPTPPPSHPSLPLPPSPLPTHLYSAVPIP